MTWITRDFFTLRELRRALSLRKFSPFELFDKNVSITNKTSLNQVSWLREYSTVPLNSSIDIIIFFLICLCKNLVLFVYMLELTCLVFCFLWVKEWENKLVLGEQTLGKLSTLFRISRILEALLFTY